ncbi:MAG: HAD hydrolase family protein [Planctomycetota bacterium]
MSTDSETAAKIRFILSDVDGVLTDGSITLDNAGAETKTFFVRDGMAIKNWQLSGMGFGILTARNSNVVQRRAAELNIPIVRQGFSEKLPAAKDIFEELQLSADEVCYVGDDLPDLPVLRNVGLPVAPSDAAPEILEAATWIMQSPGGRGVIRELVERLMRASGTWMDYVPTG